MPEPATPGQVAYEAFWRAFKAAVGTHGDDTWETIHSATQRAWEAAAEAVLDAWQAQPRLAGPAPPGGRAVTDTPITDQLKDILLLVGQILHGGTQQDLDKFHLWLADYAEVVTARRPQEAPMPETPGQICYAAWWLAFGDDPPLADAYHTLTPRAQRAWDAAAQAVLGEKK